MLWDLDSSVGRVHRVYGTPEIPYVLSTKALVNGSVLCVFGASIYNRSVALESDSPNIYSHISEFQMTLSSSPIVLAIVLDYGMYDV